MSVFEHYEQAWRREFRSAAIAQSSSTGTLGLEQIYAGKGYVEIEPQGVYTTLQPGTSLTWTVRWYVRELADPSIATVGNAALVSLTRDVIEQ